MRSKCRLLTPSHQNLIIYGGCRAYEHALSTLSHLHILPQSAVKLALNPTFKTSLRHAITGGYVLSPLIAANATTVTGGQAVALACPQTRMTAICHHLSKPWTRMRSSDGRFVIYTVGVMGTRLTISDNSSLHGFVRYRTQSYAAFTGCSISPPTKRSHG